MGQVCQALRASSTLFVRATFGRINSKTAWSAACPALVAFVIWLAPTCSQAATSVRTTAYDYELSSGLLIKEVVEPGDSNLCLVSAYELDAYGHKTKVTTRNCNGTTATAPGAPPEAASPGAPAAFTARSSTTTYTADQRFPEKVINALTWVQQTNAYDGRFGSVSGVTDANNVSTTTVYDVLGRKVLETHADGTQTKWVYVYCAEAGFPIPVGAQSGSCSLVSGYGSNNIIPLYYIQATPLQTDGVSVNGPYVRTYHDFSDRIIRTEIPGFDVGPSGGRLVYEDIQYDPLGRVGRKSRPYYNGESASWITYTYDILGRQESASATVAAGTATTYTEYDVLATHKYDALYRLTVEETDYVGQLAQVRDAKGGVLRRVCDPFGNLVQTVDPKGNTTSIEYDNRGRKTALYDPDMGVWTYVYNALGELKQQTDAKGQVTTMDYDVLGRMTSRSEPSLNGTWRYDAYADGSTCGKGRLCEVTADNDHWRRFAYDDKGRAISVATSVGATFTAGVAYHAASGRIDTQTYPSGMQIRNSYSPLGELLTVTDLRNNLALWTAGSEDAAGRPLQYSYGNGVSTTNTYYPDGRLATTQSGPSGTVQNLNHSYDLAGNLSARVDLLTGLSTAYGYDELNRITSETRSGGGLAGSETIGWAFNSIGNMTSRTEGGQTHTYNYPSSGVGSRRPHATTGVSGSVNGVATPFYFYDANGNLKSGAGRTAEWTSFDSVASLASGTTRLDYLYDADHQRAQESYYLNGALQRTTVYLNPASGAGVFYEEESGVAGLRKKHYVSAGGKTVAMLTFDGSNWNTQYWHEDHLGSVSAASGENGALIERMAYEPFGKRRNANGVTDINGTLKPVSTDRGFTEHEHIDELGLINMNGRIYDPGLGRFLSADPTTQVPANLQSYNRYSYAWNNPMRLVDPTGFSVYGCAFDGAGCGDETAVPYMGPEVDTPEGKLAFLKDTQNVVMNSGELSAPAVSDAGTVASQPRPVGFTAGGAREQRELNGADVQTIEKVVAAYSACQSKDCVASTLIQMQEVQQQLLASGVSRYDSSFMLGLNAHITQAKALQGDSQAVMKATAVIGIAERANSAGAAKGATETVRVGELIATHGKTMSNKQLDKLTKKIRAEGIKEPLTVTEHQGKLYILDGHHRALAAPRAGVAEVPIKRVDLPFGAYKTPADLTFTPGGY